MENPLLSSNRAVLGIPQGSENVYSSFTLRLLRRGSWHEKSAGLLVTYPVIWRLEAEVGGDLHVRAAEGEDAQAEIQQLQSQEGDLRVPLLQEGQGTGIRL